MADRPIIFSAQMVHALLSGRKTQTRRILNPQPPTPEQFRGSIFGMERAVADGLKMYSQNDYDRLPKHPSKWELIGSVGVARDAGFPKIYDARYALGDRLWVRESLRFDWASNDWLYTADNAICVDVVGTELETPTRDRWPRGVAPSIHMPRVLSRLTLIVESVKVERLQEISEDDVKAEGLRCLSKDGGRVYKWGIPDADGLPGNDSGGDHWQMWCVGHRPAFAALWDRLHGPDAWTANPWVCAIGFRVIRANIDSEEAKAA